MTTQNEYTLMQMVLDGTLTKETFEKAQQMAQEYIEEQKRHEEESRKAHEKYTVEQNKPHNRFIFLWNYRHVYQNLLYEYCNIYDIIELEKFANELRKGTHRHSFKKGDSIEALTYLRESINSRKQTSEKQLLDTMKETRETLRETRKDLKTINQKLNPPNNATKAKAYTT
jgi:hypothetical protein